MSDADDDIARGAAKLRAREAKADAEAAKVAAAERDKIESASQREREHGTEVLMRSLGPPMRDRWTAVISVIVMIAMVCALAPFGHHLGVGVIVVASIIAIGLMLGLPFAIPVLIARARLAAFARIGHGLDLVRYRAVLSQNRRKGRIVMTLGFERPVEADKRAAVADALRGWLPELDTAAWIGDALRVQSLELEGKIYVTAKYGGFHEWSNHLFHACLTRLVQRALPKLDRVDRVIALDVTIDGAVELWDAEA